MRRAMFLTALSLALAGSLCLADDGDEAAGDRSRAMTARVDELLAQRWAAENVSPAVQAGDAEFLRRAYLDLTGIIPKVSEVRTFLADVRPDKRAALIDKLLAKPGYATHLANTWRHMLLPGDVADQQLMGGAAGFQNWLRERFADNIRYDNVVAELLTATGSANQTGPALFYTALELKPEEAAANTSRIFLGVQIQCAQCHDHPFDRWTQQDFWGYAAFFARLQQRQDPVANMQVVDGSEGEVKLPNSETVVQPKYLNASLANEGEDDNRRRQLAIWLASRDNPFFARATVNRVWAQLFGRGLVEPVDDLSDKNPPSHPELLNELARYFAQGGFDLRDLFRTLANTRAYGLSSELAQSDGEPRPELFSRMAVKSLTPDQLYDCLAEAMRRREMILAAQRGQPANPFGDPARADFLAKFQSPTQSASEFQSGIPQALTLMNGRAIAEATDANGSGLLAAVQAPFFTDAERVEVLFLSTIGRPPQDAERSQFVEYVNSGGPSGDRRKALGDVLWALVNSAEFILNH